MLKLYAHYSCMQATMASYTAAEALHLMLGSSKDLESGDESDIAEGPSFSTATAG